MKYVCWNLAVAFGLCMPLLSLGAQTAEAAHAASNAAAQKPAPVMYQGVDIRPLVEYFKPAVKTLKHSVTVYNWGVHGATPYWNVAHGPNEPALINMVKAQTKVFWNTYARSQANENSYGYGLYAAVDPLATVFFDTSDPDKWMLTEMTLPAGAKILEVEENTSDQQTQDLFARMGCDSDFQFRSQGINRLFIFGGLGVRPSCAALVRTIARDIFKISAFAYSYSTSYFKACEGTSPLYYAKAFVITDDAWINTNNVKIYTAKTTAAVPDRIRIQTVILRDVGSSASDDSIVTITKDEAMTKNPGKLIWQDLEGKSKTPNIDAWLNNNMFGCSKESPYVEDQK